MEYDVPYTRAQLMEKLSLETGDSFRKRYRMPALERKLIVMGIPDRPADRNQTYLKI